MNATMRLKNMFKLSSKVTVYIPSTTDINKEVDTSAYIDNCATLLSNCFGGATSTNALGCWTSPTMGLVKEKTTLVFAYCTTEQLDEHIEKVIDFAMEIGFSIHNLEYSPIKGPEGNIEYLVYIEKDDNPKKEESVDLYAVVEAAHGSLDK